MDNEPVRCTDSSHFKSRLKIGHSCSLDFPHYCKVHIGLHDDGMKRARYQRYARGSSVLSWQVVAEPARTHHCLATCNLWNIVKSTARGDVKTQPGGCVCCCGTTTIIITSQNDFLHCFCTLKLFPTSMIPSRAVVEWNSPTWSWVRFMSNTSAVISIPASPSSCWGLVQLSS